MEIEKTSIDGVFIIMPKVFGDNRGWFCETYNKEMFEKAGLFFDFIQDNQSFSADKGTLRGLHFQNHPYAQTKLLRCTKGAIMDVAVDLRKGSVTYLKHVAVELSAENKKQLLIPKGFAHGFLTLTDNVEVQYKVDNPYAPLYDRSIRFDDASIGIKWGIENPILSQKDKNAPLLKDSDCNFGKKVLVTGANGQLGYDVIKKLKAESYSYKGIDAAECDITDTSAVEKTVSEFKPDCIVHCAAYTAVDKAEEEKQKCTDINFRGTENLVNAAKKAGCKFIYISTDYIYGGEGDKPHTEEEKANPLSVYGSSKFMGEQSVRENLEKYFIFRTSWVFGKNGNNFVKTMLKLASANKKISVVGDQIGSPTYTADLSNLIFEAINSEKYGTYNATNEGFCSWYDFACEIFALSGTEVDVKKILTEEYPTKAVRPKNSRLSKNALAENGFNRLPSWQNALKRFLEEL